ncbi:MAG: tyrosine-type recombinase/integrase [Muribaculaceae bacterium]|nr:tyrosine-type recombinase/integrase [Muribaculaceae bacterium]
MVPEEYVSYLQNELNRSPLTVDAYLRDIGQFISWITQGDPHTFSPTTVTLADIRTWLAEIALTESTTTLRRKTQSLRSFFRWLQRKGRMRGNPAADVILAKKGKHLPEFVRETEMESILDGTQENGYIPARDRMILSLLYSTGIRQAELLGLKDSDISFYSKEMKVTGKRNKQRILPLPNALLHEIEEWQKIRNEHFPHLPSPAPLFPGEKGPLSKMHLYRIVKKGLSSTSSAAKSPHVLRHTFATVMLNHGANLDTVKEMLGHASLSTTEIYTHLTFEQLRRNYDNAHPRAAGPRDGSTTEPGEKEF